MDLHALTLHEIHDLLDTREVSARDVTEAFYRRIETLDDRVHAYLTLTRALALEQAELSVIPGEAARDIAANAQVEKVDVEAIATGEPATVYVNVPNRGLIANLPAGCCVEVACLVDGNGVQPTAKRQWSGHACVSDSSSLPLGALTVRRAAGRRRAQPRPWSPPRRACRAASSSSARTPR